MNLIKRMSKLVQKYLGEDPIDSYRKRFLKYAFVDNECSSLEQFEASITRLYHTIEKGLSYENYRPGFGKENINKLISAMEQYNTNGYDINAFTYRTALSCLFAYIEKNKKYAYEDLSLEGRVKKLKGTPNEYGGTISISRPHNTEHMTYEELVSSRHSIRHFSGETVNLKLLEESIELAQYTPSACNRQGWKTWIIVDKDVTNIILKNQNGNRGFGNEFDKILIVTADVRAQQKNREFFQAFIDGGMYAQSILNSLYYKGIAAVPLSASLTTNQENAIRKATGINDAEVLIIFIGVGNYPDGPILTAQSKRRPARIEII